MKKFICGLLCGAVLCTAIGAFAVNSIYENPYRITVNGAEKQIQGYNIDDYSYFKLRDIADAVGGFDVGFDVGFDNDTIVLSTDKQTAPTATQVPMPFDLPIGTIPDPLYIQVPSKDGEYDIIATNDEFRIRVYKNFANPSNGFCVYSDDIADKANEIVGKDIYTGSGYDICDKTTWNDVFSLDSNISLEYYYQYIAPWLRTLK